jgi:hypothetical protein
MTPRLPSEVRRPVFDIDAAENVTVEQSGGTKGPRTAFGASWYGVRFPDSCDAVRIAADSAALGNELPRPRPDTPNLIDMHDHVDNIGRPCITH